MTLAAVVNGTRFSRAKAIRVSRSLRSFAGWFEVVSSADDNERLPIRINDRIQIVSGASDVLLTGFVESLRVRQDAGSHEIAVSGRDITADLIDSTLKTKQFTGPIDFPALVSRVLDAQGLGAIRVINEAGQLPQIKATELVSGEIGQSAFDFLEKYARRVQVVLTTNGDGSLLIMRASARDSGATLIRLAGNQANNVLSSSLEINAAGRYRDYICQGQLAPAGSDFDGTTEETTAQSGSARDSGARATRFYEFEAETPMDGTACGDRAKLEANVRRAASLDYSAVVQGVPSGFEINRLVDVRDDFCDIGDRLLITDVEHRFDSGGTVTEVGCSFKDAFTLQEELELSTAARSDAGEDFTALNLDTL